MSKLIFVGGIHGSGKGTICKEVSIQTDFVHITASNVLKWGQISKAENKRVNNIQDTQDRLIAGLNKALEKGTHYLLDGHYCLFNLSGDIERIPPETFRKIGPKLFVVVTRDVAEIKMSLEKRDHMDYDLDILYRMQKAEEEYAKHLAVMLDIPLIEITNDNYQALIIAIS